MSCVSTPDGAVASICTEVAAGISLYHGKGFLF